MAVSKTVEVVVIAVVDLLRILPTFQVLRSKFNKSKLSRNNNKRLTQGFRVSTGTKCGKELGLSYAEEESRLAQMQSH